LSKEIKIIFSQFDILLTLKPSFIRHKKKTTCELAILYVRVGLASKPNQERGEKGEEEEKIYF
jgi:hypothetical protein